MWFLLVFGMLALLCGARFAMRPDAERLRLAGALALATLLTTLTAVCTDLAMVGHHLPEYVARHAGEGATLASGLLQGFAEAMSPAILGFTLLTLATLFVALGCYRQSLQT